MLADHALVQYVFEAEKLVLLALDQTRDGHAAPLGDDFGNFLLRNLFLEQGRLLAAFLLQPFQLFFHLRQFAVAELGHLVEVVTALGFVHLDAGRIDFLAQFSRLLDRGFFFLPMEFDALGFLTRLGEFGAKSVEPALAGVVFFLRQRRFLDLEAEHFARQFVELLRHRVHFRADHSAGLVHEVDGFVGQKAVGDVAIRERHGGDERVILDAHAVVQLEALLNAAQNGQRILDGGLVNDDGLETPLERRILLNVQPILVERGGTDTVQLAAREHGFEQIARVHRTFGLAGADDGVELVDKEDDPAIGLFHLIEHSLEAFFEFAAVFRAGDERTHVQREDRLVLQALGHVAAEDALREALDDGGLAHAGLADQDGIVFRLAG